jgi:preprotein translocase subunit SecD
VIQTPITGGRAQITLGGGRDAKAALAEALDLAKILRSGSLPAPIKILEERLGAPGGPP